MDIEYRVLLTGPDRKVVDAIMWATDDTGQWLLVGSYELAPFATRWELSMQLAKFIVKHMSETLFVLH